MTSLHLYAVYLDHRVEVKILQLQARISWKQKSAILYFNVFFLFHIRSFCRRYGLMVATNVDFWNKNDSPGAQNIRGSDVL
jgi:hypothetical protein